MITKREKSIFTITAAVVLASLAFSFIIAPLLRRAQALNQEIRVARFKLKRSLSLLSREAEIKGRYDQFAQRHHVSAEGPEAQISSLTVLEDLAREAGIRIIDMRPQSARALESYQQTLIDLRTEGALEGYFRFLYSIENSLTLLEIKRFQLNARSNSQLLEGSFTISQLSLTD
jgi:hypothetical protein